MDIRRRIAMARLMEKMEKAESMGNSKIARNENGALCYLDDNGDALFEAKMIEAESK